MKIKHYIFYMLAGLFLISCSDQAQTEKLFQHLLNRHVERIKPITKKYNEAVWATYSGKTSFKDLMEEAHRMDSSYIEKNKSTEYYQRLLNNLYDNSSEFEIIMKIKKSGYLKDSLMKRQFVRIYREYAYIQNNWDKTEKQKLYLFDQFYEIKKSENKFFDSLGNIPESEKRLLWLNKFSVLTEKFRNLIKAENDDVKRLGYDNFFQSTMDYYDVDDNDLGKLIKVVEEETRDDYIKLLNISRDEICLENNIKPDQIILDYYRDAHLRMNTPKEWKNKLSKDEFIKNISNFYSLGDFDISDIYKNSDIWYKENKINNSFFFCVDLDKGDYRIYSNSKPAEGSYVNLIHEFAHALHYKYVDKKVPYLLKIPAEITSEAVAMYFDSKLYTSKDIQRKLGLSSLENNPYFIEFSNPSRLFFLRKLIRNIEFERCIYENPDQDFNELWWKLNKQFLFYGAKPDERSPEWMSNQQIVDFNGVHVFYLYALAMAAQLEVYFPGEQFGPVKNKIMKFGDSKSWKDLIRLATGEELNLGYLFKSYKRLPTEDSPITFYRNEMDQNSVNDHLFSGKRIDEIGSVF
jgi:hypothetical protein